MKVLWSRIRGLFATRQLESRLDEEIETHLELLAQEHIRQGMSPEEARFAARRSFGGVDAMKESHRDSRGLPFIETFLHDIRYAVRMLRKTPAFTAVAVLSLALGIGANTAVFTLINALILRTLPVANPSELVTLSSRIAGGPGFISFPMYRDLEAKQQVFTGILASAGETPSRIVIPSRSEPAVLDNVPVSFVTANYFAVLGVPPSIGRFFTSSEDRDPDSSRTQGSVAVLSHSFWERQFGRDPSVLGRVIEIQRSPCRIIGVAARGFQGEAINAAPDIWVPLIPFTMRAELENWDGVFTSYIARLRPGTNVSEAGAAMNVIYGHLVAAERQMKPAFATRAKVSDYRLELKSGSTGIDRNLRRTFSKPLWIIMAVVALVLIIACANIANLLLARSVVRRREIGVRLALGCSRTRLLRQLLTESVLLSLAGAVAGLAVSYFGVRVMADIAGIGSSMALAPDLLVLSFTAAVAIGTGLIFGIAPALRASRAGLAQGLNDRGQTATTPNRNRLSRLLVAGQVALCLPLLAGAGLLVKTVRNLHLTDLGFRPDHVLIFDLAGSPHDFAPATLARVAREVHERVRSVPGVQAASVSGLMLFSRSDISTAVKIDGYVPSAEEELPRRGGGVSQTASIRFNSVSPGYFETTGMTLVEGRAFQITDTEDAVAVAVVNESMARRYFAGRSAVGSTLHVTPAGAAKQVAVRVVGVVRDAKYNDIRADVKPMFYMPLTQLPRNLRAIEVRTAMSASAITPAIRQALHDSAEFFMIRRVFTLSEQVDRTLAAERMMTNLCAFFSAIALLLSCIGLFGVMAYSVANRTNEIGVRLALGADPRDVLWMVLRQSIGVVSAGLLAGSMLAFVSVRLLKSFLFQLTPSDPGALVIALSLLIAASAAAALIPAFRAARVDPLAALRYE